MSSFEFSPRITLIAAMASNRVIGRDNQLPWRLPGDLPRVKKLTIGKALIMGRKTYESIGRPLPGRLNIVLTHQADFRAEGCVIVTTAEEAIAAAIQYKPNEEIIIFGGAVVYTLFFRLATRLYLTILDESFAGDTYFPEFEPAAWQLIHQEKFPADEKNPHAYSFNIFERI